MHKKPVDHSPSLPPLSEADQTRLITEIQTLWHNSEQLEFLIGERMQTLIERGDWSPGTFDEFCADNFAFKTRHAYRFAADYQVAQATWKAVRQKPRNDGAARELNRIANDLGAIRQVQAALKTKGLTIQTATAREIRVALTKTGLVKRHASSSGRPRKDR
jgi:hypothetical protein